MEEQSVATLPIKDGSDPRLEWDLQSRDTFVREPTLRLYRAEYKKALAQGKVHRLMRSICHFMNSMDGMATVASCVGHPQTNRGSITFVMDRALSVYFQEYAHCLYRFACIISAEKSFPMGLPTSKNVDKYTIRFMGGDKPSLRYVEKAICEFFTLLNPLAKRWRVCHDTRAGVVLDWKSDGKA